ncbi:MAG: hypothetical protein Q9187_000883, partial [Circinaria calcarea]
IYPFPPSLAEQSALEKRHSLSVDVEQIDEIDPRRITAGQYTPSYFSGESQVTD